MTTLEAIVKIMKASTDELVDELKITRIEALRLKLQCSLIVLPFILKGAA